MPRHNTYTAIPPPPLPEFYQRKDANPNDATSTSTSSGSTNKEIHSTCSRSASVTIRHLRERGVTIDEQTAPDRLIVQDTRIPPLPPQEDSSVLPLVVYHICRICRRPRSARYHREHPIPIDGLPPPPGTCRRCRVTSEDEAKAAANVLERHESNEIKLGVKCLVPGYDYFTNDEMRARRADQVLSQVEWEKLEPVPERRQEEKALKPQEEMGYRHIHITVPPPLLPPPPPQTSLRTQPAAKRTFVDAGRAVDREKLPDVYRCRESITRHSKRTTATSPDPSEASHKSSYSSSPRHTYVSKPEYSESDIRRLARDEVERYRQAERKIGSHQDPYAYGKLVPIVRVPVERRIQLQRDVIEEKPWEGQAASPRRDSAFAIDKVTHGLEGDEETVTVKLKSDISSLRPVRQDRDRALSPPPSITSEKTRWPADEEPHRYPVQPSCVESQKYASKHSLHRDYETEAVKHWEYPSKRDPGRVAKNLSSRRGDVTTLEFTSVSPTRRDQKTWRHQEKAQARSAQQTASRLPDKHDPKPTVKADCNTRRDEPSMSSKHRSPYPADDESTLASMPSAHPLYSASVKKDEHDREYYYANRTVMAADSQQRQADDHDRYFKETREYLHKRRISAARATKSDHQALPRSAMPKRQTSVTSSRVRFSNKVDVSPTPPGSDASSSQFRSFYKVKGQLDGEDGERDDVVAMEYERRGRTRSREPTSEHQYHYERDLVSSGEHVHEAAQGSDRDRTPRPSQRQRRASDTSEPSTLPSNVRRWARVHSESPSREKLREEAVRQRVDGAGPYAVEERRSASVEVEDGSAVSGAGSSGRCHGRRKRDGTRRKV